MISKYSKKMATWLVNKSTDSSYRKKIDIYIYGLECFLNTGITVTILLIWSILSHHYIETLIWLISFSYMRKKIGGIHAPSQSLCIVYSSFIGMSNSLVACNHNLFGKISYTIYITCIISTLFLAPMYSQNHPLLSQAESKQLKASVLFIMGIVFIFDFLSKSPYTHSVVYAFFNASLLLIAKYLSIHFQHH